MQGEEDQRVSEAQAHRIFDRFAGRKQFELFTQTGHGSVLVARPEQWKRSVGQFLRGL